jgi:hypothetical protein
MSKRDRSNECLHLAFIVIIVCFILCFVSSIKKRTSQTPPFCYDCKFYKPLSYVGKYDTFGKCSLYLKVYEDMLQYEYADIARQNNKKCGVNGTDFQPRVK